MPNPGLAPWAMKGYRPYRALRRLPPIHSFAILMRLSYALLEVEKKFYRTVINHNILSDEFSGEFDIHPEVKTHQVSKGKG